MEYAGLFTDSLIKVLIAVVVGGVIGAEREYQDKAAGFRTIILITVGSALFTIFSINIDPGFTRTRIAANIVTGIGFLGAGAIIREGGRIGGLTTAATIWLSAALGMGIGAGDAYFSVAAAVITLIVLLLFPHIEARIDRIREARLYKVVVKADNFEKIEKVEQALSDCSLKVFEHHQTKTEATILSTWKAIGKPTDQDKFVQIMMKDKDIKEFDY
jgi:putative Mg2+ transporter-C (MgtC) family protein